MGSDPDPHRDRANQVVVLCILDGFGIAPSGPGNAITQAKTPNWDRLQKQGSSARLNAAEQAVGLPAGQMGNSEVGHLNMGAGRIVAQDIVRIDQDIETGAFAHNEALRGVMERARDRERTVHLVGLVGPGGVHSHERHHFALLDLAREVGHHEVSLHAVLDGRDTPPRSAASHLQRLQEKLDETGVGFIATMQGRYWAMDRDRRWDRTEKAYRALVGLHGERAKSPEDALRDAYRRGENDEFVIPTVLDGARPIATEDAVIIVNFRPDRARQLTMALADGDFDAFATKPLALDFVIMTQYHAAFTRFARVAYPPIKPQDTLGEQVERAGLRQLRIAETEKYAHVTYFINGGREDPFEGEERIMVPSAKVATYDEQPEMSAPEITRRLVEVLGGADPPALVVLNYANADMVGHTGDLQATVRAIESIDHALGRLAEATRNAGGTLVVTADHGNAEEMLDAEGEPVTKHTTNPVPLLVVAPPATAPRTLRDGILADVAPTILELMGLPRPARMDRGSLLAAPEGKRRGPQAAP